ncbi:MAG: RNA polymerase sigma factor region1.1 domain-containing protein, partial [Burkholderiaceae bacterium]
MTAKKTPPPAAPAPVKASAAKGKPSAAAPKPAPKSAAKPAAKPVATVSAAKAAPAAGKGAVAAKAKSAAKTQPVVAELPVLDEDVFDVESDLDVVAEAGDDGVDGVETPEAAQAETKAKVKPLRMKVPKSKERALIREFGLDVTTLTEEEATKRRTELKTLVKMGKLRGFLTQQEINDHLPEKLVDVEVMEAIVKMLNDMGIAVYEQAPDAATLLVAGGGATTATDEEAEEAAEAALSTVDSEFGRTTDPVRMYMREMGTVELLTREGEIEIAKRIEAGLQAMMLAISASPAIMAEILTYGDKIAAGQMTISEVVDGFVVADEADDYVA